VRFHLGSAAGAGWARARLRPFRANHAQRMQYRSGETEHGDTERKPHEPLSPKRTHPWPTSIPWRTQSKRRNSKVFRQPIRRSVSGLTDADPPPLRTRPLRPRRLLRLDIGTARMATVVTLRLLVLYGSY
jgi:hypothetical protein